MKLKKFEEFLFEGKDNEVISYLMIQMEKDKKEYKGHIPTKYNPGSKWNDSDWIKTELRQFLNKNISSSYTLLKFRDKYSYDELDNILKKEFPEEYKKVKN